MSRYQVETVVSASHSCLEIVNNIIVLSVIKMFPNPITSTDDRVNKRHSEV